jgi:hypothetical protein
MIIMETPAPAPEGAGQTCLGEVEELGEITAAFLCEAHNLTVAAARAEFAAAKEKALLEYSGAVAPYQGQAQGSSSEEKGTGIGDFLKRMVEVIVEHLVKIKNWIVHAVRVIMEKVFGPRRFWLAKNKGEILKRTDFDGPAGKLFVTVGEEIKTGKITGFVQKFERAAGRMADEVRAFKDPGPNFIDPLMRIINDWLGQTGVGLQVHAILKKLYIGKPETVPMTPELARAMVGVGEATFDNMEDLKQLSPVIDKLIAEARAEARDGDAKARAARLRAISWCSAFISKTLSSATSVNAEANSQALGALHRALHYRPAAAAA